MYRFHISRYYSWLFWPFVLQVSLGAIDDGPLVVTPYLEGPQTDVDAAIRLSEVKPDVLKGVKSYSGFFNVNKNCGNQLFFWFFPADEGWESKPVVLWLKGAPGTSIMTGVFQEVGPLKLVDGKLVKMQHSWTSRFNVLFIDQPVGSGFSYTDKGCYPNSVEFAMRETFSALKQFFVMFHKLKANPFYITGGYFVSHYGPSLARIVLENNQASDESNKIYLQGVLIMNGRTTPECHDFSNVLYQLGIADRRKRDEFKSIHNQIVEKVNQKKFHDASELERIKINKLRQDTKLPSIHNFAADEDVPDDFIGFIDGDEIKKQIHVGSRRFNSLNRKVQATLLHEFFSSPKELIEFIVKRDDIFVGFFHGHMEVINPYSAVNCFLKTIQWPEDEDFRKVHRNIFTVDEKVIGWTKVVGNFFYILVRKAGRFTGTDIGETSLYLLETIFEPVQSNAVLQSSEN